MLSGVLEVDAANASRYRRLPSAIGLNARSSGGRILGVASKRLSGLHIGSTIGFWQEFSNKEVNAGAGRGVMRSERE